MKIKQAHQIIEDLLTKADRKSEKKLYEQLLGALQNIQARELSSEQLHSIEAALDRLDPDAMDGMSAKVLKSRRNRFLKEVQGILSLLPEDHYMAVGLCLGVAFGGLIGSLMEGFAGIPDGQSGTGLGIGLGLVAAVIIARHLDVEAIRQNRVLLTRVH
jgi:hypothetical protein